VFFRFVWPIINLAEGMFGIANDVSDYINCLRHGSVPLLCIPETASSEKSANSALNFPGCCFNAAIAVSEVVPT
jgi:hypothetical protein